MAFLIDKEALLDVINELPDESPKSDAWQHIQMNGIEWYQCPKCAQRPLIDGMFGKIVLSRFCPYCGTKLEVKQ